MINVGIMVGFSIGILAVCIVCMTFAILAYSKVVGFENSTHQVQYVDPMAEKEEESLPEDFNPFAMASTVNESAIEKPEDLATLDQQRKYDRIARTGLLGTDPSEE